MEYDFAITLSNKGKECLMVDNCKYKITYSSNGGSLTWRCNKRGCSATVVTESKKRTITKARLEYSHIMKEVGLEQRQVFKVSCKRQALTDIGTHPAKIMKMKLVKAHNEVDNIT